uniref:Uncharacterized protein n=2 Tax=Kalmanozyma brasiliensis (strain GHG001) TaxID=1365824 RepID=V5F2S3_KALBG
MRSSQPMPAPLSRIALAAKQNQILALQALQAAAASASASSSSSSSSAAGSPPPSSSFVRSSTGTVYAAGSKRGRKFQAFRAPTLSIVTKDTAVTTRSQNKDEQSVPIVTTNVPHWSAEGSHPLFDPNSGKRSEIYSLTNDRYPGAPGTALAKAREAQQKAIQTAKREAAKKLASKAELEHLGVKGLGKKRKSSSPYATVGGGLHATAVAQAVAASSSKADATAQAMSRDSSRGRSAVKPSSETHLTVPSTSRSRRPASRASSPAPITAQASSTRRSGTRSGSVAPAEEDASSTAAGNGRNNRSSPSRGTSPPDNSKNHHGLSSTAPFQSSPLAASAITMEPLLDTEDADQNEVKLGVPATASKRKASALSHEVHAEAATESVAAETVDEANKRVKSDDDAKEEAVDEAAAERTVKEGSPSSVSSSRRTSPRMSSRRVVGDGEAA